MIRIIETGGVSKEFNMEATGASYVWWSKANSCVRLTRLKSG